MAGSIVNIPPFWQTAFDNVWRDNPAQQTDHMLAGKYDILQVAGNQLKFPYIGSQNYGLAQETARVGQVVPSDVPMYSRWVRPRPYSVSSTIGQFDPDMLGTLPNPDGAIVRQHRYASQRTKDIIGFNALLGTNYTGANGSTAVTLPTTGGIQNLGQVVPVTYGSAGANSGMTLAKLTMAAYMLDKNSIKHPGRYLAYSSREMNNLITNVDQIGNTLYNDVRALRDGLVRDFMGFSFVMSELVPFASGSTTIRTCVAWQKECLAYGMGRDVQSSIDIIPEMQRATLVYTCLLMDATRTTELGVVQINTDESV